MKRHATLHPAALPPSHAASGLSDGGIGPLIRGAAVGVRPHSTDAPSAALGFPKGHVLHTWRTLNAGLHKLTEQQAWDLLKAERTGPARVQLLLRLYGRGNKLRAARERRGMLSA